MIILNQTTEKPRVYHVYMFLPILKENLVFLSLPYEKQVLLNSDPKPEPIHPENRNNAPKAWCPPILCCWTGEAFGGQQSDQPPLTLPHRCKSGEQDRAKKMAQGRSYSSATLSPPSTMGQDDFLVIPRLSQVVREDLFYSLGHCGADGHKSFPSIGVLIYDISLGERPERTGLCC